MINYPTGYHADDMMIDALYQQGTAICKSRTKALHGYDAGPKYYNGGYPPIPQMPSSKERTKNLLVTGGVVLLGLYLGKKTINCVKGLFNKIFRH